MGLIFQSKRFVMLFPETLAPIFSVTNNFRNGFSNHLNLTHSNITPVFSKDGHCLLPNFNKRYEHAPERLDILSITLQLVF